MTLLLDCVFIIVVFLLISKFQNKGRLVSQNLMAPDFNLLDLQGNQVTLSNFKGKTVVLYFFAPWCQICQLSSDNLNDLRQSRDKNELEILIVGLDWNKAEEIELFAQQQQFISPVLYGTQQQILDYNIKGYPTYFIINKEGRVIHRSVGYSTEIGLRLRT